MKKELVKSIDGVDVFTSINTDVTNEIFSNWDSLLFPNENVLVALMESIKGTLRLEITGDVKVVDLDADKVLSNEVVVEIVKSKELYNNPQKYDMSNNWFSISWDDYNEVADGDVFETEPANIDELVDVLTETYLKIFA
jgi:hypothetical protein